MRRHYAIFWTDTVTGRAMWARASNRVHAMRHARARCATVYAMTYGHRMAWDAPTFQVCGDRIADYRRAE